MYWKLQDVYKEPLDTHGKMEFTMIQISNKMHENEWISALYQIENVISTDKCQFHGQNAMKNVAADIAMKRSAVYDEQRRITCEKKTWKMKKMREHRNVRKWIE